MSKKYNQNQFKSSRRERQRKRRLRKPENVLGPRRNKEGQKIAEGIFAEAVSKIQSEQRTNKIRDLARNLTNGHALSISQFYIKNPWIYDLEDKIWGKNITAMISEDGEKIEFYCHNFYEEVHISQIDTGIKRVLDYIAEQQNL